MFGLFKRRDFLVEQLVGFLARAESQLSVDHAAPFKADYDVRILSVLVRRCRTPLCVITAISITLGGVLGTLWGASALLAGVTLLGLCIRRARRQRELSVDRDLPALLTSIASSVRAGIDPLVALSEAREFIPADSPLAEELELYHRGLTEGGEEDEVVDRLFRSISTAEIELFKGCLRLSRKHGSSLAEPLHRVTRVVRQRQSFRRKTRAALAMHRISAIGISMCAALIGLMQVVMNPLGIQAALSHSIGAKLLVCGGTLIVMGVIWMMALGRETSV